MIMKVHTFRKFLLYLIMNILFQASHLCKFTLILSKDNKILRKMFLQDNIYLSSMRFLYRKSLFKNIFVQNFLALRLTGELIVYPCSVVRLSVVRRSQFQRSSPLKPLG